MSISLPSENHIRCRTRFVISKKSLGRRGKNILSCFQEKEIEYFNHFFPFLGLLLLEQCTLNVLTNYNVETFLENHLSGREDRREGGQVAPLSCIPLGHKTNLSK